MPWGGKRRLSSAPDGATVGLGVLVGTRTTSESGLGGALQQSFLTTGTTKPTLGAEPQPSAGARKLSLPDPDPLSQSGSAVSRSVVGFRSEVRGTASSFAPHPRNQNPASPHRIIRRGEVAIKTRRLRSFLRIDETSSRGHFSCGEHGAFLFWYDTITTTPLTKSSGRAAAFA